MKTVEFLDALKRQHSIESDYGVSKLLGITRQRLSNYRSGRDFFGDEIASQVAQMLGLDPGYVMACAHAERAATAEIRAVWESVAAKLAGVGAVAAPAPSKAQKKEPLHIM